MHFLDFVRQFRKMDEARNNLFIHLEKNSLFKKYSIVLALFINYLPLARKIPFVRIACGLANSLWLGYLTEADFGYVREVHFQNTAPLAKTIPLLKTYDYIVVGSGPGAVAGTSNLPQGSTILVIEKGSNPLTSHKYHHTLQHVVNDFEKSGQEIIATWPLSQFAQGATLGGGSEVNSGLYHRLPSIKREVYLNNFHLNSYDWQASETWVETLLRIQKRDLDPADSLIARGAAASGLEFSNIPRWREYSNDGSFKHFGMIEVFWSDFFKSNQNHHLLTESRVVALQPKKDGIVVKIKSSNEGELEIFGKKVLLAAGSIQSPRILAESNLIPWNSIKFQWHPMYRAIVKTKNSDYGFGDIDPYQAWTSDYSLKFGSAVSTPGLLAIGLNRQIIQSEYPLLRSYYVSHVSSGEGGLIPKTSTPWYSFSDDDRTLKLTGTGLLKDVVHNGGGQFLDLKTPVKASPSTVHIFGTLPIDSKFYDSGTNALGKFPAISICDASILPEGPGVNPQGVVMAAVKAKTMSLGL